MNSSIELKPKFFADVSGGKDSLFMLKYILSHIDDYPLDGVIHYELEIDYPFVSKVVSYMKEECNKIGIPFYTFKPKESFYDLYHKKGLPSRVYRWCNNTYKKSAINEFNKFQKSLGNQPYHYIGFCFDETKRYEKFYPYNIYPLVDAQIYEKTILEWAKKVPLFNDFYLFNKRQGCMFCPMASRSSMAYLKKYYPKEYDWFYSAIWFDEHYGYTSDKPYYFLDKPIEDVDRILLSYIDNIEHQIYFMNYE